MLSLPKKNITRAPYPAYNLLVDMPILFVRWFDSTSDDDWEAISEKLDCHEINTIGWFIAETDDYVTLALNIDQECEDEPLVSQKISIPKVNILHSRKLKLRKVDQ